jgi:outer membrane immunogenic protein
MKKIIIIVAMSLAIMSLAAQERDERTMNHKQLNFGVLYGSYEQSVHPDITVKGELSLGAYAGSSVILSAKGNYYWDRLLNLPENWDLYSGVGLGIFLGYSNIAYIAYETSARWHWSEKWSLNFGYSNTTMGLGVTMKL